LLLISCHGPAMVRFKNRYLLVEVIFPEGVEKPNVTEGLLFTIIKDSLAANFGEVGWGQVGGSLNIKYLSRTTGLAIVRTSRPTLSTVWAAITFIRSIKGVECCPRIIHVGGTIRKTQQAAIRYDRQLILASDPSGAAEASVPEDVKLELQRSKKAIMALDA